MRANKWQTNITLKPARVGVRADDVGAKRPEEACIPRDGGLRGGVQSHAYPEMAVCEGEFKATHIPRWQFKRGSASKMASAKGEGSYIAQIRGVTVGMRHMSVRQASHTNLSK